MRFWTCIAENDTKQKILHHNSFTFWSRMISVQQTHTMYVHVIQSLVLEFATEVLNNTCVYPA